MVSFVWWENENMVSVLSSRHFADNVIWATTSDPLYSKQLLISTILIYVYRTGPVNWGFNYHTVHPDLPRLHPTPQSLPPPRHTQTLSFACQGWIGAIISMMYDSLQCPLLCPQVLFSYYSSPKISTKSCPQCSLPSAHHDATRKTKQLEHMQNGTYSCFSIMYQHILINSIQLFIVYFWVTGLSSCGW